MADELVKRLKKLVHEGSVRRVVVRNDEGHILMEIPLNVGVVGTMLVPFWVALGAVAAMIQGFTIEIEREHPFACPARLRVASSLNA